MSNLLLQLQNAVHQCLAGWRTSRHIHIDRHDPIASPHNAIAVVVIPTPVRAAPHADDPSRLWHLVIYLTQCRRHLVCERAGDNHDIGLAGRGAKDDAETILIVARGREMHHFDGAAGQAECHGPE